jgi:hypothetical protein
MSDSLALSSTPLPHQAKAKLTLGARFTAALAGFMESLVSAQRKRFEDSDPMLYKYPPF